MPDIILELTDTADAQARMPIEEGLEAFNLERAGYVDSKPLAALARDPTDGTVLGGMLGRTSYGMLFIDLVHLPEALRGRSLGRRLLELMEAEGRRRGCRVAMLMTISFQAPDFYARNGWREFGRLDCDPPGTARVFMTKQLV